MPSEPLGHTVDAPFRSVTCYLALGDPAQGGHLCIIVLEAVAFAMLEGGVEKSLAASQYPAWPRKGLFSRAMTTVSCLARVPQFSLCLTIVFLLQLAAGILGFVFSDKVTLGA